ncbi:anti-anti-sigma factor [Nocardia alba]|uniref:Anti-anti-sigma factor n=2 Tax=Nocardia alba TaxID=225051 RepID=A0A4R1FAC1_9NOCA|nr:anti-anti-sigma factor [Nocardia alba]
MPVVMDRRHSSQLRWYRGCSADTAAELALLDPRRPGCWVLRGGLELDAARMPRFRALLDRSVRSGARVVVLDLRGTEFLSIRIAAMLRSAKAQAWAHGVDIRLLTGTREVERALDLVGVRPLFRYYLSIDEASVSEPNR